MLRGLFRLLTIGLILAAAGWVASRLMNRDEDFDDFDDIDLGLDFAETPVEIDVPYTSSSDNFGASGAPEQSDNGEPAAELRSGDASQTGQPAQQKGDSVIEVDGIGPSYAAKLETIGITTLGELASANPDSIAESFDVIGGRDKVQNWIEQAQQMTANNTPSGSSSGE